MRSWRKLSQAIVLSERLGNISDAAFRLYVYLLAKQDDAGEFPASPRYLRELSLGVGWSDQRVSDLVHELGEHGLISLDQGYIVIDRGSELNGVPHNVSRGLFYRRREFRETGTRLARDSQQRENEREDLGERERESSNRERERKKEGEQDLPSLSLSSEVPDSLRPYMREFNRARSRGVIE